MSEQDNDQATPNKDCIASTIAEKVRPIQERARQMGFVSDGSDDKAFIDEAWGEGSKRDSSRLNNSYE